MSLDLGQSYFRADQFGYDGQNAADIMGNDSQAVLYVFHPYENQFGDVGLRPFQYQFDENFLGETQQITDMTRRGSARAGSLVSDLMATTNLNDYIVASPEASLTLRTSHLSDRYRFILVLTHKANNLMLGNTFAASTSGNNQVRRIYTGFFEDEPFNPLTLSSNHKSFNPNSFMVVTHKTVLGTMTEHGQMGSRTSINMQTSEEIISSPYANSLISSNTGGHNGLHLMTPENCINSIESTSSGHSFAVPGAHSDISRDQGNNIVADILEQPAQNVGHVVKGLIRYGDDLSGRDRLAHHRVNTWFDDSFMDDSADRMRLGRYLSVPRSTKISEFDLDIDSRISPIDIDNLVNGSLKVVDFDLHRPQFYETADQAETSFVNQYSFLISAVVVPILNSAGLNAMQFTYQVGKVRGLVQQDFQTHSAEPNWPVPQSDLIAMTKAVEAELANGIFATIFHSKGDFHVAVSANVTGMTVIRLNLVGQGYRNYVDFEIPSCMGGLVSPLLGDLNSHVGNSEAIETLYGTATGTPKVVDNFNGNDNQFMDMAKQRWNDSIGSVGHNSLAFDHGNLEID